MAPGTLALLPGLILTGLLWSLGSWTAYVVGCVVGVIVAIPIASVGEEYEGRRDPPSVVIDEIVALPLCFFVWLWQLQDELGHWPEWRVFFYGTHGYILLGHLVLFRLFDIWKPWPVRQAQVLWRGLGIVMDDVLAALWVNGVWFVVSLFLFVR